MKRFDRQFNLSIQTKAVLGNGSIYGALIPTTTSNTFCEFTIF